MEIFLRYVADPGFQSGVTEVFCVERTTVSKTYDVVMDHIFDRALNWIRFLNSVQEMNDSKLLWQTRYNLQTHRSYINRKGYPSINVQTTCVRKKVSLMCVLSGRTPYMMQEYGDKAILGVPNIEDDKSEGDEDVGPGPQTRTKVTGYDVFYVVAIVVYDVVCVIEQIRTRFVLEEKRINVQNK
ncbi:hypothetical protein PR048_022812 [Dryococelus australis]|uniref:Uncharacterized protein n=1 Tax=Dryococelus australis TaxID=614101 RepID=A0ABQ9GSA2_9NEOP|nr:hypothetical protein PR048_022812 [Dryococelus australis]